MEKREQLDNFKFKKKYGQNFINDEKVLDDIISKGQIDKDTLVIEIGPGSGNLTRRLAKVAKNVLCYEIDESLKDILANNLLEFNNVTVKFSDFLECNLKEDIKSFSYQKLYVVANIPYYITTPIIMKIIEELDVDKIIVMVQKEVGDRFGAKPNSKDYGSLTVFLNYYFDIEKICYVDRNSFIPVPNVDSVVVSFTKKENKIELNDEKVFFKLIKDSFHQKRKTLKNNLKDYDFTIIKQVLAKYDLNDNVRAEQISLEVFAEIANNLKPQ